MNNGIGGWYGLMAFLAGMGALGTVISILVAAAIRLMVRDEFFEKSE